ncbi:Alpha/Beta hydrolase protein [Catenaria anguillulae PL171]|uniref:Palmitoyl-protein thioesterase 1 n=1 Tax=Catenaria anguillulae PL171 TaxID=765915 RepID=A0A1Y2HFA3_9FUNG|nr:Alpha/Beta hydrolase protein [Catenaria anguillulae PL171]
MTHCNHRHAPYILAHLALIVALAATLAASGHASRDDSHVKWVHGNRGTANKPLGPPVARPIVIWHGMGDAAHSEGMSHVASRLTAALPKGTLVHSIQVGRDDNDDRKRSYLDNLSQQIAQVCQQLQSIPAPAGFHAIGFSQGGLFLRAIAQKCPQVHMKRLITWASPHQGIADVPPTWCKGQPLWCGIARTALRRGAYVKGVQTRVVQAGYVKTPTNLEAYRSGNLFLPDINNENNVVPEYAKQIMALEKLVLIKHADDSVLSPPESAERFAYLCTSPLHG